MDKRICVGVVESRKGTPFRNELSSAAGGFSAVARGSDVALWVTQLSDCDVVVAHVETEQWSQLANSMDRRAILIRLSGDGFGDSREHDPSRYNKCVLLHLRKSAARTGVEDWREILSHLDAETIECLLVNRGGTPLDKYFLMKRSDHLLVLSMLCQTYVAVYGVRRPDSTWGPAPLAVALDKMRWPSFMEQKGQVQTRIEARLGNTDILEVLKRRVRDTSHWRELLGIGDPVTAFREEWGIDERAWNDIAGLLKLLEEQADIPEPREGQGHPVAEALVALLDRLGGRNS